MCTNGKWNTSGSEAWGLSFGLSPARSWGPPGRPVCGILTWHSWQLLPVVPFTERRSLSRGWWSLNPSSLILAGGQLERLSSDIPGVGHVKDICVPGV